MTIKVYGNPLSIPTSLVLAVLQEKEVTDYELVVLDVLNLAHKTPEFLKLQPFGQSPVLVDGPLTLFESRAIARFIANKFEGEGTRLYGATLVDRALVEQWMEVDGHNFFPVVKSVMHELLSKRFTRQRPDEEVVLVQLEKLGKLLDVYEAHLTKNKYLAGDFFSLADLAHTPALNQLISIVKRGEIVDSRPHVKGWWEDISSRPSWKKVSPVIEHAYNQLLASATQDTPNDFGK